VQSGQARGAGGGLRPSAQCGAVRRFGLFRNRKQVVSDRLDEVPRKAPSAVVNSYALLGHLRALVGPEVAPDAVHVRDAPDDGDLPAGFEQLVNVGLALLGSGFGHSLGSVTGRGVERLQRLFYGQHKSGFDGVGRRFRPRRAAACESILLAFITSCSVIVEHDAARPAERLWPQQAGQARPPQSNRLGQLRRVGPA